MRRLLPLVALAVLSLGLLGALVLITEGASLADDVPPPVFPSGLPGPDVVPGDTKPTQGPTYVVTPDSPGSALPTPSKTGPSTTTPSAAVNDARSALNGMGTKEQPAMQSAVAGPVAATTSAAGDGPDWWLIGAGGLLMLLLIEVRWVTGRMLHEA